MNRERGLGLLTTVVIERMLVKMFFLKFVKLLQMTVEEAGVCMQKV